MRNTGEIDLHDVSVVDTVPPGVTITAVSQGGVINGREVGWHNLNLSPSEQREFFITVRVHTDVPHQAQLVNHVKAHSDDHAVWDSDDDTTTVVREKVAAIVDVPITAPTGAGGIGIFSSLLGGGGLLTMVRRFWG